MNREVRQSRTQGLRRGKGVRVRGGRGAASTLVREAKNGVVTDHKLRGGPSGRARGRGSSANTRPASISVDELRIYDISELPEGQGLETSLRQKRMRKSKCSAEPAASPAPPRSPNPKPSGDVKMESPILSPANSVSSPALCPDNKESSDSPASSSRTQLKRRVRNDELGDNFGSDAGSDDDNETDDPVYPDLLPTRVFVSTLETPLDTPRLDVVDFAVGPTVVEDFVVEPTVVVDFAVEPTVVVDFAVEPTVVEDSVVEPTVVVDFAVEPTVVEDSAVEPTVVEDFAVEPTVVEDAAGGSSPTSYPQYPGMLYDFVWKSFPKVLIPPELRRETFSQINVGPTTPHVEPYDIFIEIWDRQIMEHIVLETNKYAQQVAADMLSNHTLTPTSRITKWRDTTVDEMYVYFGILLAMGVVVKSSMDEYWRSSPDIFYTPGFSATMSCNRFKLLSRMLHFNDNAKMCELQMGVSEARLFKIQPLLLHLGRKFESMYVPQQNVAIDESLLQWMGSLDISQLIRNKAATRGIKSYELCESQTGYLWRFEIHSHKGSAAQRHEDPMEAAIPSVVLRLCKGLEHKGYTLWMDNYYNSPCLARRLKSLGFDCVGTLRTDRQFVPPDLHGLTKWNMRTGEISGLTSGDVDVMVWKDINRVAMISTYHGIVQQTQGASTKPTLIHDYNIMMGGVDKKDQMLAMYPVERKRTKVWYKKLFRRMLNVSVLNSYIIHSSHRPNTSLDHRSFRISLILSLLSRHASPIMIPPIPVRKHVDITHRLSQYPVSGGQRQRRNCVVCKRRIHTFCTGCSKTVCIDDCYVSLHTLPLYTRLIRPVN